MDHGTLALLVPLMALSIPFFAIWTRHQRRLAEMHLMSAPQGPDTETQRRIGAIEERLRVLERIATDGRHSNTLAAEIEALRDPFPAPAGDPFPAPGGDPFPASNGTPFQPVRSTLS